MSNRPSLKDLSDEERVALATRLREMVEQIGTQPRAAEVAGVSLRALEQYLSGKVAPSLLATGNLAAATGYSLDWVLTGQGAKARDTTKLPDPRTNPGDAAIASGLRMREILGSLWQVKEALARTGAPLDTIEEEDEVLGGISDAIEATGLPEHMHPVVAAAIATTCQITSSYLMRKGRKYPR